MRIEDIEIKPNNKRFDEKNWDINEWRKEYPVDYFNLSAMLVKPDLLGLEKNMNLDVTGLDTEQIWIFTDLAEHFRKEKKAR